jgi:hypothetical protein
MSICVRCQGDSFAWRDKNKPLGGEMSLVWICSGCHPHPLERPKPRGLTYYRRLTYQIVLPVIAAIFALVELGIHL